MPCVMHIAQAAASSISALRKPSVLISLGAVQCLSSTWASRMAGGGLQQSFLSGPCIIWLKPGGPLQAAFYCHMYPLRLPFLGQARRLLGSQATGFALTLYLLAMMRRLLTRFKESSPAITSRQARARHRKASNEHWSKQGWLCTWHRRQATGSNQTDRIPAVTAHGYVCAMCH